MASSEKKTPLDEKKDREGGEEDADRISLRGLSPISAPVDLTRTVPDLIRRRSRGRFFGRKRLSDRLPLEWMSLGMLLLLGAIYAALKLLSTN
jgi:hypothetical protein